MFNEEMWNLDEGGFTRNVGISVILWWLFEDV
jgi:hypothetical protein